MTTYFYFILGCFMLAAFSFFIQCLLRRRHKSVGMKNPKTDWLWLLAGLLFTVVSDYFLILRGNHLAGVAVFCLVHVCYIMRAINWREEKFDTLKCNHLTILASGYTRKNSFSNIASKIMTGCFVIAVVVWVLFLYTNDAIIFLAITYATLFLTTIAVTFLYFNQNKAPKLPRFNKILIVLGLILFALCDINVMLYNLPRYLHVRIISIHVQDNINALIWIFYLPSQLLLAISGIKYYQVRR